MKKGRLTVSILLAAIMLLLSASCGAHPASSRRSSTGNELGAIGRKTGYDRLALFPAQVSYLGDAKWGYIGETGKFVLQPVYSQADRFQSNGLAVAGRGGKAGLIDTSGKFVLEPVFSSIGDFSDGLSIVTWEDSFQVLDSSLHLISEKYPFIDSYREGRAAFYVQEPNNSIRYGYLDEAGRPVIEPAFEYAEPFDSGLAVVRKSEGLYALIDRSGKMQKALHYSFVMGISDGMIPFMPGQNSRYGYLNSRGDVAIAPAYLDVRGFSEGTAVVNAAKDYSRNLYGLIDKKGKYLINPQYNDILQLGEGMVALGLPIDARNPFAGSKYALAEQNGRILTDFVFYGMEKFRNGVASVYTNDSTFFIDKTGKRVESLPSAEGTGKLELLDSLVYADIDNRAYYLDRKGNIVYKPSSTVTLNSGIKVSEEKYRPNRNYLVYYPSLSELKDLNVQESINDRLRGMWTDSGVKPTDNLDYNYTGGFSIGFNRKNLLELEETAYEFPFGAAHGMPIQVYAHVNTLTGRFYQLEDLFKEDSDYTSVLSKIVKQQIDEHGEEMGVWPDSYKGIRPDQPFFLSADALMLYFEPYEIAPYAAGFPTFTVPFAEISDIIDRKGSFWLSFH